MTIETVKLCSACSKQGTHQVAAWRLVYPTKWNTHYCGHHKALVDSALGGICEWTKIKLPNGFKA